MTGGAGFIGSALVRHLVLATSHSVVTLDRMTYAGNVESLAEAADHPRHRLIEGDVTDEALVGALFAQHQPDVVMHLAAESHVDRSIDGPGEFVRTNVVGTLTMLQAATEYWKRLEGERRARFRFLQISTDEVFGSLGSEGRFTEESPHRPNSPYAASKAGADHLVRAWHHTYGLPTLTSNCSNNFGPYQFPEKLIPLVILNGLEGKPLPVYGTGSNVRDWLYVDDHVSALLAILERGQPGETYCVGGGYECTNLDVVHAVCGLLDELAPDAAGRRHSRLITMVSDRPGHDQRYAIDASRAASELGWSPHETFATALRRTVAWYLAHQATWCARVTSGVYRRERLGLGETA